MKGNKISVEICGNVTGRGLCVELCVYHTLCLSCAPPGGAVHGMRGHFSLPVWLYLNGSWTKWTEESVSGGPAASLKKQRLVRDSRELVGLNLLTLGRCRKPNAYASPLTRWLPVNRFRNQEVPRVIQKPVSQKPTKATEKKRPLLRIKSGKSRHFSRE
jgi:hypothetical protein